MNIGSTRRDAVSVIQGCWYQHPHPWGDVTHLHHFISPTVNYIWFSHLTPAARGFPSHLICLGIDYSYQFPSKFFINWKWAYLSICILGEINLQSDLSDSDMTFSVEMKLCKGRSFIIAKLSWQIIKQQHSQITCNIMYSKSPNLPPNQQNLQNNWLSLSRMV